MNAKVKVKVELKVKVKVRYLFFGVWVEGVIIFFHSIFQSNKPIVNTGLRAVRENYGEVFPFNAIGAFPEFNRNIVDIHVRD